MMPYFVGRWRSWLSHLSNTQKVLSSSLGRLIMWTIIIFLHSNNDVPSVSINWKQLNTNTKDFLFQKKKKEKDKAFTNVYIIGVYHTVSSNF